MSMKNSNYIIRNRTRDLQACSAVPPVTASRRITRLKLYRSAQLNVAHGSKESSRFFKEINFPNSTSPVSSPFICVFFFIFLYKIVYLLLRFCEKISPVRHKFSTHHYFNISFSSFTIHFPSQLLYYLYI